MKKKIAVLLVFILIIQCLLPLQAANANSSGSDWKRLHRYRTGLEKLMVNQAADIAGAILLEMVVSLDTECFPGLERVVKAAKFGSYAAKVHTLYSAYKDGQMDQIGEAMVKEILGLVVKGPLVGFVSGLAEKVIINTFEMGVSDLEERAYNAYISDRLFKGKSMKTAFDDLKYAFSGLGELCSSYVREHKSEVENYIHSTKLKTPAVYPSIPQPNTDAFLLQQWIEHLVMQELEKEYQVLKTRLESLVESHMNAIVNEGEAKIRQGAGFLDQFTKKKPAADREMEEAREKYVQASIAHGSYSAESFESFPSIEGSTPGTEAPIDVSPPLPNLNFAQKVNTYKAAIDVAYASYQKMISERNIPDWFTIGLGAQINAIVNAASGEATMLYGQIGIKTVLQKYFIPALNWVDTSAGPWVDLPSIGNNIPQEEYARALSYTKQVGVPGEGVLSVASYSGYVGDTVGIAPYLETWKAIKGFNESTGEFFTRMVSEQKSVSTQITLVEGTASIQNNKAVSPGYALYKATYKGFSVYGVVVVKNQNEKERQELLNKLRNEIDKHRFTMASAGVEFDDGLERAGLIQYQGENRARYVLRMPVPYGYSSSILNSTDQWRDVMKKWFIAKERAESTPQYILQYYPKYMRNIPEYSYMEEARMGYRTYTEAHSVITQYTQEALHNLITKPVSNYADKVYNSSEMIKKMEDWFSDLKRYNTQAETLKRKGDISRVTDLSGGNAYFLTDHQPIIKDSYLVDAKIDFLKDYLYAHMYAEKYTKHIDLEDQLYQWAVSEADGPDRLESLGKKAEGLYDQVMGLYKSLPGYFDLYAFKEEVNYFLGHKVYYGGEISTVDIENYHRSVGRSYGPLKQEHLITLELIKDTVKDIEFKKDRLEKLLQAYRQISVSAIKAAHAARFAVGDSPLLEELEKWLKNEYGDVVRREKDMEAVKVKLKESVNRILKQAGSEGIIDPMEIKDHFDVLSNVEIKKSVPGNSEVNQDIKAYNDDVAAIQTGLAKNRTDADKNLQSFRKIQSYALEYRTIPTAAEINTLITRLNLNTLLLDEREGFFDFVTKVETKIQAPERIYFDIQKADYFFERLLTNQAKKEIKPGSLTFSVTTGKGWWCVSLTEGKVITAESADPEGDINIRLDDWAYMASNALGGIKLLGDAPMSQYGTLPGTGYCSLPIEGDITGKVYALLLADGTKVKLYLKDLEMENPTDMRTVIEWE